MELTLLLNLNINHKILIWGKGETTVCYNDSLERCYIKSRQTGIASASRCEKPFSQHLPHFHPPPPPLPLSPHTGSVLKAATDTDQAICEPPVSPWFGLSLKDNSPFLKEGNYPTVMYFSVFQKIPQMGLLKLCNSFSDAAFLGKKGAWIGHKSHSRAKENLNGKVLRYYFD